MVTISLASVSLHLMMQFGVTFQAMCYRNAKTSSSSRSRSPRGLLLLDFDDIDSTNVFGYKDDRIQNDLLDEICSDIGIKDAIDLDFLDFDGATAACGAEYAAATNDGIFLADDLGDLDQTIPFGQLQREEGSGDTRHGHLTNAGQPRSAGCPEFLQQPRSCSADTYVMSPMSHSSCHSNQPGSSSSRNNLLDSSLESIGADYLGSCGDAAPSGVRMTCYDPPSVGSQHGSISSVPSSPRTDYKDSKRGRTMAADMKCSSPCRRDRFGNGSMVTAGGNQSGFANGSSHMQYTNIQNLVRSGASMVHSPGGASRSQFGELTSGSQSRPPSVSTSQKRSGFQCKLESTFDPGYYSVGSPSVCSGSSIMTAKVAEEAVTRDKVARYLDDCTMQQNYPLTDSEKQLSAAVPCGGAGGGMMSSPIKLVHSQPESPQSVGHVAKRARVISSGNELLEEVRECYSYVKGANMFAQARTPAMPGTHPAAPQNNSGARLMNGSVPPVSIMNGQVNPNPMNVSPATMQSNCRQQQLMQQQQQMMQQQQQQQMARFATPRNPRVLGTPQGYPQHQPQYGHSNMPAPMRTNNSFVTSNSFVPQGGIVPRMASYPVNSSASCNFTPVPPSDRTTCSYGTQPSASGYGTSYQNGCLEKENYHGAAPCQQIPNANFGGRTSNECQFFGYQTPAGPNALRYANSVDQFHSTSAMMSPGQPSRNQCGRAGGTGASFSGMHAASSMPNLAGNVPGFHSHPSGGSNPALNSIMNEFRPPQQQHSPKLPTHHQMAPPHQASGASTTSVQGQQGLIQRIISDQTNAFRSHSLFPLLRDLIIADMNFHSPTFPFQLIANLPTDFDKLLQNYLHRNPAAGDGRHGNQAVGKVIEDALRFAHKALIGIESVVFLQDCLIVFFP